MSSGRDGTTEENAPLVVEDASIVEDGPTEEEAATDNLDLLREPSPTRRSRASSLIQRLTEDGNDPSPVLAFNSPVDERAISDHRQLYVGVHMPMKPTRIRSGHGHHRSHHHPSSGKYKPSRKNSTKSKAENVPAGNLTQPPAERVRFILGGEGNDVERQIFSEMDELCTNENGVEEWKETARWLKFEEDVEEGGNRWSKPHVATVSLHSLFELRNCIMNGTVLLDLNASNLSQIADIILDDLVASRQLDVGFRPRVREILLRKHRHLYERRKTSQKKKSSIPFSSLVSKKSSTVPNNLDKAAQADAAEPQGEGRFRTSNTTAHLQELDTTDSPIHEVPTAVSLITQDGNDDPGNESDPECSKYDVNFMKKIPPGAEGSMVLVGESDFLSKPISAFIRLEDAQNLGDIMEVPIPVRFLFLMLGPPGQPGRYHEIGRSIATLMSDEVFHDVAYVATCREDIAAGIDEFLQQVTVLPPGEWDPSIRIEPPATVPSQENRRVQQYTCDIEKNGHGNGIGSHGANGGHGGGHDENELVRTGRFAGGLVCDIKRRAKVYTSDFVDALNSQCLASILFIYFACLAPIVTFGGVMQAKTNDYMGAMEQLLACCIGGVMFSLFSGQPLTILGATGPMLVFEEILFNFCDKTSLDYMPFRMWIGLWTAFFCLLLVVTDASALVRYFTRFTEESFATLIGLIFIYEGAHKLFEISKHNPIPSDKVLSQSCECMKKVMNGTNGTDIYVPSNNTIYSCDKVKDEFVVGDGCGGGITLLSTVLTLGTFFLVVKLKAFKTSRFFPTKVRKVVSDFAVILAVMIMVGVDFAMEIATPKLKIPIKFEPTKSDARGWIIHPLGRNPWWTMIAASIPALLTTILVFMDQQITAVIVNKREHKLRKGAGYHLDLTIVAIAIAINSMLGLPWVVAATVLSLSHVQSLFVESQCTAPGERPKFLGVREQRVTGTVVFTLVGCTVFLGKFLKYIPMPVLYGLFIYMGVSALKGVQFFERIKIIFMPVKHQPDRVYLRKVRIGRIHIFTAIQFFCLAFLWAVKTTPAAITFPLMVLALVAVRKLMDKIFTKYELEVLDDVMPESIKKKIEEGEELDDESEPLVDNVNTHGYVDSGINITEELKNTSIWKSIVGNKENNSNLDGVRSRKPHKHKRKHRHHRHVDEDDGTLERKLSTVPDAPDLEKMANEDNTESATLPLVTLTNVDERTTPV